MTKPPEKYCGLSLVKIDVKNFPRNCLNLGLKQQIKTTFKMRDRVSPTDIPIFKDEKSSEYEMLKSSQAFEEIVTFLV